MFGLFLCSILLLGQGFSQEMVGKGLNMAHAKLEGYNHLLKLIVSENEMSRKGQVARVAYPLSTPRPDYRVTSKDVRYFLKHSLLSRCTASQLQTNSCFCEGRFDEAKVFRNETLGFQSVVAADPLNKLIVISYQMPLSEKNWESNNKNFLVSHPAIKGREKVHRGHLEDALSIHSQMKPAILAMFKDPEYQNYKLHVTGYSFGASIAAISLPPMAKIHQGKRTTHQSSALFLLWPTPRKPRVCQIPGKPGSTNCPLR
ncbi:hypothetical protein DSO57_1001236 [Entomophthora muscae]|uniref:Uncharacterized protein n=1 Tax=Entomophthora muscae TaxID=34485 RepID=A0ACC2SLR6_9FUNG|nr:hypothetical protein DSO57_1001236 [Entomophthora muscae]